MAIIRAANYTRGRLGGIRVIVIHTAETPEQKGIASAVANYFARSGTQASAHLCVDDATTVRCVDDADTAWAAPGANSDGLQIELAGRAGQDRAGWEDSYSQAVLRRAAREVAAWCTKYRIPARRLSRAQLRAGEKGIVGHADVSAIYKRSDHNDPGGAFPWTTFISLVQAALELTAPAVRPAGEASALVWPGRYLAYRPGRPMMRGQDVTTAQKRLKQLRYTVDVDGVYGPMTAATIRVLQRAARLAADGVVGPDTWSALWR